MPGEAGRRGDEVRSDLFVRVEAAAAGGIALDLESRVEPLYGASIREQCTAVLEGLGVQRAKVTIEDQGALPFTIAARIEAAARAAGLAERRERAPKAVERGPKSRLRRSRLYLPGDEPKFMVNAGLYGADALILDLEDSVHPAHKAAARVLVRHALAALDFGCAERMVRINQLPLGLEDLAEVVPEQPDLILVPKVEHPDQIREVDAAAGESIWLMPILESALGIERAFEIATASERVAALTIGLEDYTADLGVAKTRTGAESAWARSRVVQAACAAGVQPIDSVYGDVDDLNGLRVWGQRARALGFVGMGCVHPRQVAVIHEAFAPSEAEIEKALRIVAAFEEAEREGLGVVSLGSKMIDVPVVERARQLVERARAMGLVR